MFVLVFARKDIERPEDAELENSLCDYEIVGAEVVSLFHRPSLTGVFVFDENAGSLPLHVDECIEVWRIAVFLLSLVVEDSEYRIP